MSDGRCLSRAGSETTLVAKVSHYETLEQRFSSRQDSVGRKLCIAFGLQAMRSRQQLAAWQAGREAEWPYFPSQRKRRDTDFDLQRDVNELLAMIAALEPFEGEARLNALRAGIRVHIAIKEALMNASSLNKRQSSQTTSEPVIDTGGVGN